MIWNWGWVWKSSTVNNARVGFRLYNDGNGAIRGSVTIVDSTFSDIHESAIEMVVPVDVRDSGFTGLVLDNVNLGGKIKDHWSPNVILAAGYYKNVSTPLPETWMAPELTVGCVGPVRDGCNLQGQQADLDKRTPGLHSGGHPSRIYSHGAPSGAVL